jgi:hypothetical protein
MVSRSLISFGLCYNNPVSYSFEYSFVIPSTIAGFDRTPFGGISHHLRAELIGQPMVPGRFGSLFRFGSPSSRPRSQERNGIRSEDRKFPVPGMDRIENRNHERQSSYAAFVRSDARASPPENNPNGIETASSFMPRTFAEKPELSDDLMPPGISWLNGKLSSSKEMWIVPLLYSGPTPPPLLLRERMIVPGLGEVPWSLSSQALTVGGLAHFDALLDMSELNLESTIWSIRLSVDQQISVQSIRGVKQGYTAHPPQTTMLLETGRLPTAAEQKQWYSMIKKERETKTGVIGPLWQGSGVPIGPHTDSPALTITKMVRMPNEDRLRPSTHSG